MCRTFSSLSGVKFLIVDNGSTDGSFEYLSTFSDDYIRVVHLDVNIGYGNGISEGIKYSDTKFTGWLHADQTELLGELMLCLEMGLRDGNFYKGRRTGRAKADKYLAGLHSLTASLILGISVRDINSQPNIFPTSFLNELNEAPKDFSFELYHLYAARRKGLNEVRFKVSNHVREFGNSSWNRNLLSRIVMGKSLTMSAIRFRRLTF